MTAPARPIPVLPEPYSRDAAEARILTAAASQIGYREGRSDSGIWNNDNAYGLWYGMNGVSWCAEFVSWCADQAGYLGVIIPRHAYTPTGWNWFKNRGLTANAPQPGYIVYVYGYVASEGRSRVHHVGLVERVLDDGYIQTIEGNTNDSGSSQGNGVYRLRRRFEPSRLLLARPNYAAVIKPPPPGVWPPVVPVRNLSLAGLRAAADRHNLGYGNYHAQRVSAISSLKHDGLSPTVYPGPPPGEGFDELFRTAWAAWQRRLGYKGADADGIPGEDSFRKFCAKHGYRIVS
jgi:hypothetical protein